MVICKICNEKFKRFNGHMMSKHKISVLSYIKEYQDYDVINEYLCGKSAREISTEIIKMQLGISPNKTTILTFLRENGIRRRSSGEGEKLYYETHHVWNKGLTKKEHPSIKQYADSRTGKDNPLFKASPESYDRFVNWWKYKSNEEVKKIRQKIGDTIKEKYRSHEIVHWTTKLSDEQKAHYANIRIKKFREWIKCGGSSWSSMSQPEKKIGIFLENREITYIKQFTMLKETGWYKYDYCVPIHKAVIEFNGTYWHCDPRIYDKDYYHSTKGCYAWELWKYDKEKKEFAENNGYRVYTIWENDIARLTTEEYERYFNEIYENQIYTENS